MNTGRSVSTVVVIVGSILWTASAVGQVVDPGVSGCTLDKLNEPVCVRRGGTILLDKLGNTVCGTGQCLKDKLGDFRCSRTVGGGATKNNLGEVVCVDGCEIASRQNCVIPTK